MVNNVKEDIPDTPLQVLLISPDRRMLCLAPGNLIAQMVSHTDFVFSSSATDKLDSIIPLSTKSITWDAQILDKTIKVKEAIYTFMPQISQNFLIKSQHEEKWIASILATLNNKGLYQNYF